jgi:hypothetical protein
VELVGDDACVGKERAHEASIRVAHVDGDDLDVLASRDVLERLRQRFGGASLDELE